jgi:hypothetical protein
VLEEGPQGGQPLIARRDVIASRRLQMLQESEHPLEGQISDPQLADGSPRLRRDEGQEDPQCIAVTPNGSGSKPLLSGQILHEKAVDKCAERDGRHGRTSAIVGANASNRRFASANNSLVIVR